MRLQRPLPRPHGHRLQLRARAALREVALPHRVEPQRLLEPPLRRQALPRDPSPSLPAQGQAPAAAPSSPSPGFPRGGAEGGGAGGPEEPEGAADDLSDDLRRPASSSSSSSSPRAAAASPPERAPDAVPPAAGLGPRRRGDKLRRGAGDLRGGRGGGGGRRRRGARGGGVRGGWVVAPGEGASRPVRELVGRDVVADDAAALAAAVVAAVAVFLLLEVLKFFSLQVRKKFRPFSFFLGLALSVKKKSSKKKGPSSHSPPHQPREFPFTDVGGVLRPWSGEGLDGAGARFHLFCFWQRDNREVKVVFSRSRERQSEFFPVAFFFFSPRSFLFPNRGRTRKLQLTKSLGSSDLNLPPIARNSSTPTAASQRTSALRHCRGTGVPAASSDPRFLRALREAWPARAEETPTPRAPAAGARRGVAQESRRAKQVACLF